MNETEIMGTTTSFAQIGAQTETPVIMVHGFRGDHHGLIPIAEELHTRHPELSILIPDLPGFGESDPIPRKKHNLKMYGGWLKRFADTVAPNGSLLFAHSFGTLVASQALDLGYQPKSTVLVNPISAPALAGPRRVLTQLAILYYRAGKSLPPALATALLAHPLIVRVMSEVMAKTGDRELRSWIHNQHDQFFSSFHDRNVLLDAFEASVSHTVGEFSQSFSVPTQIISGNQDDIAPLYSQLELSRKIAEGNLAILTGVGHLSHYEAPGEVAEIASGFWESQQ